MTSSKQTQYFSIPFIIDGQSKIVKSVTKDTTCDDVINKLPKTGGLLAVFRVVNGEEKELQGKTKLLKVWRSRGSTRKCIFEVKASEGVKEKRMSLNIFGSRKSQKSVESASKDKLKQVTDLAFYVQYQKSKLQKMNEKNDIADQKVMQKVKSTSSVDSMDAFLGKADLKKMGQFLDFCSGVTASHLGNTPNRRPASQSTRPRINKDVIKDSLKTMKLGFKKTLTSKISITSKTTSTSTVQSTDTGYASNSRDNTEECRLPAGHTFIDADISDGPRHSTPVTCQTKSVPRRDSINDTFDVTLTTPQFDEEEGKSELMMRFMADTTQTIGTNRNRCIANRRRNMERSENMYASAPVLFQSQKDKCQFYWNQNVDSDSDSSCSEADSYLVNPDLDDAFVEGGHGFNDDNRNRVFGELSKSTPKRMRRESAVSNLNKYDICAKTFDDTVDSELEDNGFSYSFNCTFPEFSESQDFTVDYSCSDSDSDLSCSFEDNYFTRVKDEDFDSFMKSTLVLNEKPAGAVREYEEKTSEFGSDEGLGSMTSDSFNDEKEVFI